MVGTIQGPKSSLLTLQHGDAGGWYQINDLHIIGETFGQPPEVVRHKYTCISLLSKNND